jgi:hypothetical protein
MNYVSPDIRDVVWTPEEDQILVQKQRELGCKWVQIATFLPSRTDAMAKNRLNRLKRREQKRLESLSRPARLADVRSLPLFPPQCIVPISTPVTPEPETGPMAVPSVEGESSLWEDSFPLDDCFIDAFAWI